MKNNHSSPEKISDAHSGAVTFLFTDVEGSTQLWEQHPEAMRSALARHDALLRNIIETLGGRVIKTTGDGLHAVFTHPSQSVSAALSCQEALFHESWSGLPGPIRVRMGLHTGEAELRDGDYYGSVVNRAAGLMSIAAGGQTLLSAATCELAREQLPEAALIRDLGEHRLKDLTRPEHIFQLSSPGLPSDFPALRSLDALPNNLPLQLTSFIGREGEMAEAKRLLAATRLLTLTGPGGTGKTRLSLQVAAEGSDDYPAGVWLLELAPLSDPALVPQTAASVLGVRQQPGRPLVEALIDYLRAKSLLLILDNCEHLVDACAQLATTLLSACPKLRILVSSREALGVAGETILRVPSLSLPDLHASTPQALNPSEAVRLFVERAQAAQPGFALTEANLGAVVQICRRLDGIPLALELAAARLKLFSAEQIAARLDDRFRLLTGGSRTALPRQQTLRALIDWSYDLLDEAERKALNRLSVFAGGWTFEAAEAVAGPETLELMSRLVDKSLVVVEDAAQAGEKRYRLLETIRQYGGDKLLESGESQAARDLHLAAYLSLVLEAEPKLDSPELVRRLDRLEPELDNFRQAMEWALERSPEAALQISAGLLAYWQVRGNISEGQRWLSESQARVEALAPVEGEAKRQRLAYRAKGLWVAGTLAFENGELNAARLSLEESLPLARQSGEKRTLSKALGMLGFTDVWLGDAAAAEAVIEEDLRLAQTTHNSQDIVMIKAVQANQAALIQHDFAAAKAYTQDVFRLLHENPGNPWTAAVYIMGLGTMAAFRGDYSEALRNFKEGEALFRSFGDRHMVNAMQSERAHIERRLGNLAQAAALYSQTLLSWQEIGNRAALAHELECLAFIAAAQSQFERAACLLGAAEALRESVNSPMRAVERDEYEQNVSALRAQLEPEQFAAAWAEGRALTMEQAVAYAAA